MFTLSTAFRPQRRVASLAFATVATVATALLMLALFAAPALTQDDDSLAAGSVVPFGSTPAGTPLSMAFEIDNNDQRPLRIMNFTVEGEHFTGSGPTELIPPGGKGRIVLTLASDTPGTYRCLVSWEANSEPVSGTNQEFHLLFQGEVTAAADAADGR
ncbi:MAG: DUF1573 domain-containing protein [Acidobacteriota bacterium]